MTSTPGSPGQILASENDNGVPVPTVLTAATTHTYESFGRTEMTGAQDPNPFRFTGQQDDRTGLYYYRARYYIPPRRHSHSARLPKQTSHR